ncbi:hypothetical protein BC939DRAFT_441353 [Gamsiella multidivaricata]|uniref:uncharacterized protein n=1 Tax=Gamsiella multidivaricata TaxID=101098 RepID=UPI002220ED89|nr:uncharacterized protein BC939DRAFT_441353 [Gamsiella multidivaricata]KAI7829643.1 hypothetical protein BC939DRAFT_441353 [Gamsiella multidivaricata]
MSDCLSQGCPPNQACFLYSNDVLCQPFQVPDTYPATNTSTTIVNPPGWYIASAYPSVRYTGSLANQTQGANCTTIPVPVPSYQLYHQLIDNILLHDLGMYGWFDYQFSSTLVQYRGNCAENFYCQPSVPVNTEPIRSLEIVNISSQLPGTCQGLKAENQPCLSSNMCQGWHIQSDGSYNNDQFRCIPSSNPVGNSTVSGKCVKVAKYKNYQPFFQGAVKTSLLSIMLVLFLVLLYMWYRRQKARQPFGPRYHDNTPAYLLHGGVYRPPDGNDNGELPAYGAHRRDERIIGPGSEEIGMYSFSNQAPLGMSSGYPSTAIGPAQQNYPFPMTHPGLNTVLPPAPSGTLYPPPLTPQQAEAAALAAAAAAALSTLEPSASQGVQQGRSLPPAYEPSLAPAPATTPGAAGETANVEPNAGTGIAGEKQELYDQDHERTAEGSLSSRNSFSVEKPLKKEKEELRAQDKDTDQASTSSSASGSGSGSSRRQ